MLRKFPGFIFLSQQTSADPRPTINIVDNIDAFANTICAFYEQVLTFLTDFWAPETINNFTMRRLSVWNAKCNAVFLRLLTKLGSVQANESIMREAYVSGAVTMICLEAVIYTCFCLKQDFGDHQVFLSACVHQSSASTLVCVQRRTGASVRKCGGDS